MLIKIEIIPNSNHRKNFKGDVWKVYTKSDRKNNSANKEMLKMVVNELEIDIKQVKILTDRTLKYKKLEIVNENI